jgi:hypothetical protein
MARKKCLPARSFLGKITNFYFSYFFEELLLHRNDQESGIQQMSLASELLLTKSLFKDLCIIIIEFQISWSNFSPESVVHNDLGACTLA